MKRRRVIWMTVVALLLTVIGGALGYRLFLRPKDADARIPGEGVAARGRLLPQVRRYVYYSGHQGKINRFKVKPNEAVSENQILLQLDDLDLMKSLAELRRSIESALQDADNAERLAADPTAPPDVKWRNQQEVSQKRTLARRYQEQYRRQFDRVNASEENLQQSIVFSVKAPPFTSHERDELGCKGWTILNTNFVEEMTNRTVRPNEPILRLGAKQGPWELELGIPSAQIGQVCLAFERLRTDELDVDFLLDSDVSRTFRGKLHKNKIASELSGGPVVAYVRIDGNDIEPSKRVPSELLTGATEVDAKIHGATP